MLSKTVRIALAGLLCTLISAPSAVAQTSAVEVIGLEGKALTVSLDKIERRTVVTEDRGLRTTFEGVALRDVLAQAGVVFGEKLRGKALAQVVIATARDGYQVAYAIAELDAAFTDHDRPPGRSPRRAPAASRYRSVADRRAGRQAAGAMDSPGEQDRSEAAAMSRAC